MKKCLLFFLFTIFLFSGCAINDDPYNFYDSEGSVDYHSVAEYVLSEYETSTLILDEIENDPEKYELFTDEANLYDELGHAEKSNIIEYAREYLNMEIDDWNLYDDFDGTPNIEAMKTYIYEIIFEYNDKALEQALIEYLAERKYDVEKYNTLDQKNLYDDDGDINYLAMIKHLAELKERDPDNWWLYEEYWEELTTK